MKKNDILIKYNVTAEGLINRHGKISNAIMTKALKFLDEDCIEKIHACDDIYGYFKEFYVCKPIKNYNKTAYTLIIKEIEGIKHISCNCQYATMKDKMCSHALALSIKTGLKGIIKFDGGVR